MTTNRTARSATSEAGSTNSDDGRMVYVTPGLSDVFCQPRGPLEERDARVFDRYYIVSPGDRRDLARRLTGTIWGTAGRRGGDVSRNFTTSSTGRQ